MNDHVHLTNVASYFYGTTAPCVTLYQGFAPMMDKLRLLHVEPLSFSSVAEWFDRVSKLFMTMREIYPH